MPKVTDFTPRRRVFLPTKEEHLAIYKLLLRTSMLNAALDRRRGELPLKIFTSLGQEAISVGAVMAANPEDWFAPSHRDLGVWLGRGFSENEIVCHAGAFRESLFQGYDFGPHIASRERHIIRFISDMAGNAPVGTGLIDAIYYLRDVVNPARPAGGKENDDINPVLLAFFGDGALSDSNAHSAFKIASTKKLPVLFIINNNGLGIKTLVEYQSPNIELARTVEGYGIKSRTEYGNDVVLVWRAVKESLKAIREDKGPHCIEFKTFRVSGHNADETAEMAGYVSRELVAEWQGRNPLELYTHLLKKRRILDEALEKELKSEVEATIASAFEKIKSYSAPDKLHAEFAESPIFTVTKPQPQTKRVISYGKAINEALKQAMEGDMRIRVFGEDVGSGGVHGITKGMEKLFGDSRIFNTPLDENGFLAFAAGMALVGLIPSPEVQFFPFIKYGMGILTNFAGTNHAITGEKLPMVIRAPFGGGFLSNNCHQECLEAFFAHSGGFKIVCPATPYAAKGLLLSAFRDGNPVIFMEQISHYEKKGEVPEEPYLIPIGEAEILTEGNDISLITYGAMMVERTLKAAEILKTSGLSAEIIDLQTIVPMDVETILESVTKTGRALIIHEAKTKFGAGAEISRIITEKTLEIKKNFAIDYPIYTKVLGSKEGPVTSHKNLEALRMPSIEDIVSAASEVFT